MLNREAFSDLVGEHRHGDWARVEVSAADPKSADRIRLHRVLGHAGGDSVLGGISGHEPMHGQHADGATHGTGEGRRNCYVVSALLNLALMWVVEQLLDWG